MPIDLLKKGVFEPEATALMVEAFEAACEEFDFPNHKVRELIAKRVIQAARSGDLNPIRLRMAALAGVPRITVLSGR
jgi:hypothetical protein